MRVQPRGMDGRSVALSKLLYIPNSFSRYDFRWFKFTLMFEEVTVIPYAPRHLCKHIPVNVLCFLSEFLVNIYEVSLGVLPAKEGKVRFLPNFRRDPTVP